MALPARYPAALLVLLAAGTPGRAQFESLSPSYDGSRVHFVSVLREKGSTQPGHGKVFVADISGFRARFIRQREEQKPYYAGATVTNFYDAVGVSVSGDESVVATTARRECTDTGCSARDLKSTKVYLANGLERECEGGGILSRNGKWLLETAYRGSSPFPYRWVIDLPPDARHSIGDRGSARTWATHGIADDGTAVVAESMALPYITSYFFRPPDRMELLAGNAKVAAIDAAGKVAVLADRSRPIGHSFIFAVDVETRLRRLLFEGEGDTRDLSISADGARVLFVSDATNDRRPQIFIARTDGTAVQQVTSERPGVRTGVLSGNGMFAWAVSYEGELLRFDLANGERRQVIGRTPFIDNFERPVPVTGMPPVVPGGLFSLRGSALGWAGEVRTVRVDGRIAPLVFSTPWALEFQIPWETPVSTDAAGAEIRVELQAGAHFELPTVTGRVRVVSELPAAVPLNLYEPPIPKVVHQDFAGAVTYDNPALPGEIVHVYMTGLGRVSPAVPTGASAPSKPPAKLVAELRCSNAEVMYAGLAPGTVGYYLVSLRLPADLEPAFYPSCTLGGRPISIGGIPTSTVPWPPVIRAVVDGGWFATGTLSPREHFTVWTGAPGGGVEVCGRPAKETWSGPAPGGTGQLNVLVPDWASNLAECDVVLLQGAGRS